MNSQEGKELGQLIRERRQSKNYTLEQLVREAKLDTSYVSKIENDKLQYPPSRKAIATLANTLDLDEYDLNLLAGHIPLIIKPLVCRFLRITGDRAQKIMQDAIKEA